MDPLQSLADKKQKVRLCPLPMSRVAVRASLDMIVIVNSQ